MATVHAPSDLRRRNRDLVLRQIVTSDEISRAQIAERTGLTQAAVWRIARELIDVGLVKEGAPIEMKGRLGRRNVRLVLNNDGAYVLGIALGVNGHSVSIANTSGKILARRQLRSLQLGNPYELLEKTADQARKLIAKCGVDRSRLLGAGVAIAGHVDHESGVVVRSNPLGEEWSNIPVAQILTAQLGMPHRVDTRPNALLLAEQWNGHAAGLDSAYLLNSSVGLGQSQLLNGELIRMDPNRMIDIAHYMVPGSTKQCTDGRKGSLQAVASGYTVLEAIEGASDHKSGATPIHGQVEGPRLAALVERAKAGDEQVKSAFRDAGRNLGVAVSSIFAIAGPQAVILAGIVGRQPDYIEGIRETLRDLYGDDMEIPLHISGVTSDEAAIWLGLDDFVYSQELDIERLRVA